eukprot:GHVR01103699.1.p1 GENE.GHVR01103699.1~~GHVR01103699.1.p1  ORF type:complete len:144 (+),score=26.17 GHVR01103699.1:108-539(+)
MTSKTTAAASDTSTEATATVAWPQRFGTIKSLSVKQGRKGRYAVMTVDCKKFEQTAFAFTDKTIDQMIAAGEGAAIWFKGPIEQVARTNENGASYSVDQMKVVYFKDKTVREGAAPEAAAEDGVAEDTAAAKTDEQVDEEIPF